MERTGGVFWKLPKTIRIGENSGGERELLGEKKSHRFLKGLYLGDLYILLLQGSRGKPQKKTAKQELITNYSYTKAIHWKQEASL